MYNWSETCDHYMICIDTVQTERDYVVSLSLVMDRYMPEMCREDVPQTLRGKRGVIFGNIEKIHEFHSRYFVEALAKCENEPFKISQCFLKYVSYHNVHMDRAAQPM